MKNKRLLSAVTAALILCTQMSVYASAEGLLSDHSEQQGGGLFAYPEEESETSGEAGQEPESVSVSKYAPGQVQIIKATSTFDSARVYWQQLDCNGYEILIKENGSWRHAGWSSSDKSSKVIRGLKKGKKYWFRVRAYNKIDGRKYFGKRSAPVKFRTKGYKQKIDGVTYIDGILIANKTYSLPKTYNPGGLTATTKRAFNKMCSAASQDGIYLYCVSGFRSYETQKYLYDSYVKRDGKAAADRYSARPGHSEHQSGLALDVNNASGWFDGTKEALWIEEHCWEYGFILRYPQDKENITGYKYESWHIRYVGKSLAKKLTKQGLTLEEYFGITSKYKNG